MNKISIGLGLIILSSIFYSCVEPIKEFSKIPPGLWRGTLYLTDNQEFLGATKDDIYWQQDHTGELPFIFEVVYDDVENFHIVIRNGEERIKVDDITYGRDRSTAKDTLTIKFPVFDTEIYAITEEHLMEGYWQVNYRDNYRIKFKAIHGDSVRFKQKVLPDSRDITGRWQVTFSPGAESEYPAVGIFDQKRNIVNGTFLTETGDYRFLEGVTAGNRVFMSAFDGAHAFLFEAKVEGDSLQGFFFSGNHFVEPWIGRLDDNASIGDAYNLTLPVGAEPLNIRFPNTSGDTITLEEPRYKDKIKLVMLMGTWCPNCKDESDFILEYMDKNKPDDIEVLALAFERYDDESKNMAAIQRYKAKEKVPFEVLLAGSYRKAEASKVLPQLSGVKAFPTLLILDKQNRIRKIHTGFAGPATPEYATFKTDFNEIIQELRNGR